MGEFIVGKISSSVSSIIKDINGNGIVNISLSNNVNTSLNMSIQILRDITTYDKDELRNTIRNEIESLLSSDNFTTWNELLSIPEEIVEEPTEEPIEENPTETPVEETPVEEPTENEEEIVIPPNGNNKEE